MARKRKKAPFYEVIRRTGAKPRYDKLLGQSQPQESGDRKSDTSDFTAASPLGRAAGWPKRPKMLLFNAGRIEISLPYQLAVAILLGLVLLILVAFRLGQNLSSEPATSSVTPKAAQKLANRPVVEVPERAEPVKRVAPAAQRPVTTDVEGNNRIVIQTWQVRAQLEPVKEYFASCGVETEIISEGGWYYLATKEKYDNPGNPGTDGYIAKQKIIELGAKYEPPPGSASFGPKPFHDAYGKRFDE